MAGSTTRMLIASVAFLTLACSGSQAPKVPPAGEQDQAAPAVATTLPTENEPPPVPEELPDEPGARELQPGEELEDEGPVGATSEAEVPPETSLHEAMEAYEAAKLLWQQGSLDDALAALDHAYERMSRVPPNGDAVRAQEKENLRYLISRRIVEIHAARQTAVGDPSRSIPQVSNDDVKREIASFRGPERDFFLEAYRRSGLYRPMIVAQLSEAGLPEQLSWLPLVESGFKERALSRARALGLWQFIASTGYRYGLERSSWIDERLDPEKSTQAALAYLTALHGLFGDWLTALAAYNCGEREVLREIQHQPVSYFDQFWDLYARLPRETRRCVPRFLAVLAILEDPAGYGFELPVPLPPVQYERAEIARATQLAALDRALALESGTLAALNPELRNKATPATPYTLKTPIGTAPTLLASLATLPAWKPASEVEAGGEIRHRVREGESLWILASRYGTTVERIRRDNGLSGNLLRPGQVLTLRGKSSQVGGVYVVRRGDTLGRIAQRQGISLSDLLAANRLSRRSSIYPGQQLTIPR